MKVKGKWGKGVDCVGYDELGQVGSRGMEGGLTVSASVRTQSSEASSSSQFEAKAIAVSASSMRI